MESARSAALRSEKSGGYSDGSAVNVRLNGAPQEHAIGRLGSGFNLSQLVSEYRALRASVLELWRNSNPEPHECDLHEMTLFNESIDQSLATAVDAYSKRVDQTRDLYLGILSHDLRNPLNSITMSAAMLPLLDRTEWRRVPDWHVAALVGMDEAHVRRALRELVARGHLERAPRPRGWVYRLTAAATHAA